MSKTYEMRNNPEYINIEDNFSIPQLHNNYLEEKCIIPEYDTNFNIVNKHNIII